jgi:putative membrane protein
MEKSDPRVYFAAERTLLAWIRTGLTIMAIGFMVARFGLFVRLLTVSAKAPVQSSGSDLSTYLGVLFVFIGAASVFFATRQHHRFVSLMPKIDRPYGYSTGMAVTLGEIITVLGLALTVHLAIAG